MWRGLGKKVGLVESPSGEVMRQRSIRTMGNEGHIQTDSYVGIGWLLLSILLFTLVFLPVVLL